MVVTLIVIDSFALGELVLGSNEIEFIGEIASVAFFCKVYAAKIELAEPNVQFSLETAYLDSAKYPLKFPALSVHKYLRWAPILTVFP